MGVLFGGNRVFKCEFFGEIIGVIDDIITLVGYLFFEPIWETWENMTTIQKHRAVAAIVTSGLGLITGLLFILKGIEWATKASMALMIIGFIMDWIFTGIEWFNDYHNPSSFSIGNPLVTHNRVKLKRKGSYEIGDEMEFKMDYTHGGDAWEHRVKTKMEEENGASEESQYKYGITAASSGPTSPALIENGLNLEKLSSNGVIDVRMISEHTRDGTWQDSTWNWWWYTTPGTGILNWENYKRDPFTYQIGPVMENSISDFYKNVKVTTSPVSDHDSDGLTQSQEILVGTNPRIADTDSDGLLDGAEVTVTTDSTFNYFVESIDLDFGLYKGGTLENLKDEDATCYIVESGSIFLGVVQEVREYFIFEPGNNIEQLKFVFEHNLITPL